MPRLHAAGEAAHLCKLCLRLVFITPFVCLPRPSETSVCVTLPLAQLLSPLAQRTPPAHPCLLPGPSPFGGFTPLCCPPPQPPHPRWPMAAPAPEKNRGASRRSPDGPAPPPPRPRAIVSHSHTWVIPLQCRPKRDERRGVARGAAADGAGKISEISAAAAARAPPPPPALRPGLPPPPWRAPPPARARPLPFKPAPAPHGPGFLQCEWQLPQGKWI
jgi:hypothetical protein